MQKKIEYLDFLSKKFVDEHIQEFGKEFQVICRGQLIEALYRRLSLALKSTVEALFLFELESQGKLEKYIKEENLSEELLSEVYDSELNYVSKRLIDCGEFIFAKISPRISEVKNAVLERYKKMLFELFYEIDDNKSSIERIFFDGKQFSKIDFIEIGVGDSHNGGKTTTIVGTELGKFVYKPHSVQIDEISYELFHECFWDFVRVPKVLNLGNVGFCEFINNEPVVELNEAKAYYKKLGGLCAIISVLKSRDIHVDNILCNNGYPTLIDLEMIISPQMKQDVHTKSYKQISESIYGSCLMPYRLGEKEVSFLFDTSENNISAPIINGQRKNIEEFQEDFLEGFCFVYVRCIKEKDILKTKIDKYRNSPVRVIIRATNPYVKLIHKVNEWGWIKSDDIEECVIKELSTLFVNSGDKEGYKIVLSETKSVLNHDVPYFWTKAESKDIFDNNGIVYKGYFEKDSLSNVKENLENLSINGMNFDIALIKKAISKIIRLRCKIEDEIEVESSHIMEPYEFIEEAEKIFQKIYNDKIITLDGDYCWFAIDSDARCAMSKIKFDLLNGYMGICIFFAAIYKVSKKEWIRNKALDAIKNILAQIDEQIYIWDTKDVLYESQCNLGLGEGLAGVIYSLYFVNKYTEIYVNDRIEKIISIANKVDLSNSVNDLFAGISGMIRVLTEFDDIWKLKGAKELSNKLAILLMNNKTEVRGNKKLWITLHDKNIISGTAHGQSGIASALISYGNRVGNQKCVEAALDAIEYECSIYSEKLCGWPDLRSDNQENVVHGYCSGEAGIGINSLNYIDKYSELNLKRAISLCLHEKDGYRDHLCCGNCSRIEFLLEAGERLGDEKLSRQAKVNISRIVLKSKKTGGYNFLDEKYEKVFSPTLFFGAAGIGYELLRCSYPSMIDTLFL